MSNAKLRFESRLAEGFTNIWGVFDHKHNRFVKKEDGYNIPVRVAKEERGAMLAEQLNAAHEAAEKVRRDKEFETTAPAPKKTTAKRPTAAKTAPKAPPAPKEEPKPAPMKRSAPKVTKPKEVPAPKPAPAPAPVAAKPARRKKAA